MSGVRRAFMMSSIEQYLALLVNFVMLAVLARLLTPSEIGLAVIGMGITNMVFALREFVTVEFLIQRPKVERDDIRTSFTVLMIASLFLAAGLYIASQPLAVFYAAPDLPRFLTLGILAALVDSVALPTVAILRRELAFGILATVRTSASLLTAAVTVVLAWRGHGSMSYAWGILAGAVLTTGLVTFQRPAMGNFQPSLSSWRSVFTFGCYRGATSAIERGYETLPQLVLGRIMPLSAVAYYNRANAICGIPDRLLLSSIFAVAFPALAAQVRAGKDVKDHYLRVLSYITVVYWPALLLLVLTADTVVHIVLGDDWTEVTPIVQILSLAALFWFPVIPTNPLLLALGKNRDAFAASLVARSVCAVILCSASFYGLIALAMSQLLAIPFQMMVALIYAKKHVAFTWKELLASIFPSAVVTVCALAPALCLVALLSEPPHLVGFFLTGLFALLGWAFGLVVTRHPFMDEVQPVLQPLARHAGRLAARPWSPAALGGRATDTRNE